MVQKQYQNLLKGLQTSHAGSELTDIYSQQHFIARRYAAEQGDIKSQMLVGFHYFLGEDHTQRNPVEALKWFRRAASRGEPVAQTVMGIAFARGDGVPKDPFTAVEWIRKAALQGQAEAQYFLGHFYENGEGVTIDMHKALDWYTRAAEQHQIDAIYCIGVFHDFGLGGLPKSTVESVRWYRKAAEMGSDISQHALGYYYENADCLEHDLDEAIHWYTRSAEQNYGRAQYNLGIIYLYKRADIPKAIQWLRRAADAENAKAIFHLTRIYMDEEYGERDLDTCLYWCEKLLEHSEDLLADGIPTQPLRDTISNMRLQGFSASRAKL